VPDKKVVNIMLITPIIVYIAFGAFWLVCIQNNHSKSVFEKRLKRTALDTGIEI